MNVLALIGRLAADPELKFTGDGKAIAKFRLAVKRTRGQEKADFIPCAAFGRTAELAAEHLAKGDRIVVAGSLRIEQWETPAGERRSSAECVVERLEFLDKKRQQQPSPQYGGQMQEPWGLPQPETPPF